MPISYEIDFDRRKFLDECDHVIRIPGTFYLEETVLKGRQKVICTPLFSYIGIKENDGEFELEERYLNISSNSKKRDNLNNFLETIDKDTQNSIKNRLFTLRLMRDISRVHNLNISKNTFERFKRCKFKIWSEIPQNSRIRSSVFSFFGLILYCFENNLPLKKLNQHKEIYKELLRRSDLKFDILNIQNKKFKDLTKEEKQSCNVLSRLFEYLIVFQSGFTSTVQFHPLYSFLGPVFLNNQPLQYNIPEAMIFDLSLSTMSQKNFPLMWHRETNECISYINGLINDKKLRIGLKENPLEYSEIIIVFWEPSNKLFGQIFYDFFSNHTLDFNITTAPKLELNLHNLSEDIEIPINIHYSPPYLIMIGPKDHVNRAAQEILESENGSIHFNSTSQTFSGSYGAKFLKKDEFKLPEPLESKSDSVKIEGDPIKIDEQAKLEKKYARVWTNETGPKGEIIDKQRFDELEKRKFDYDIFIIDNGEHERDAVGSIYFKENEIRDFTSLKYRILFYTLSKNGFPREAINIIENCWFGIDETLKDLKKLWIEKQKDQFHADTNFLRAETSKLNQILKKHFGIRLITKGTGLYRLDPETPKYCVIKIDSSTKKND